MQTRGEKRPRLRPQVDELTTMLAQSIGWLKHLTPLRPALARCYSPKPCAFSYLAVFRARLSTGSSTFSVDNVGKTSCHRINISRRAAPWSGPRVDKCAGDSGQDLRWSGRAPVA